MDAIAETLTPITFNFATDALRFAEAAEAADAADFGELADDDSLCLLPGGVLACADRRCFDGVVFRDPEPGAFTDTDATEEAPELLPFEMRRPP